MTPAVILAAVLTHGPTVLPAILQIAQWIRDGKKDVTPEDIKYLIEFGKKTSGDYLREAGGAPAEAPRPV